MIKLKTILNEMEQPPKAATPPPSGVPTATQAQPPTQPSGQDASNEYSPSFDVSDFENKIAQSSETAKNALQEKLMSKLGGKKVLVRASKGYGQPKKDYTINVSGVSIDFYYERYVVILKDEKDKEYFLETGMKIKILGPAEANKPQSKKTPKQPSGNPLEPKPAVTPVEKTPNAVTQGI